MTERADLSETLARRREFLRYPARGLTDDQAALPITKSELCLGGLIKHVAQTEDRWMRFAVGGAEAMEDPVDWVNGLRVLEGETLAGLLDSYAEVARRTEEPVTSLDLDVSHPLPTAPLIRARRVLVVRQVLRHIIAETSHHAGHADIIRESLDGAMTMG